jgi:hypothetical protein
MATTPVDRPFPLNARVAIGQDSKGNQVYANKVLLDQINGIFRLLGGFTGTGGADYGSQIADLQATVNALIAASGAAEAGQMTLQPFFQQFADFGAVMQQAAQAQDFADILQSAMGDCCSDMTFQDAT